MKREANPFIDHKIWLSRRVEKFLKKVERQLQKKIMQKIKQLTSEDCPDDVRKLEGYKDLYRIRSGDYRIVFERQNGVLIIYVIVVAHRKEVYSELQRLKK